MNDPSQAGPSISQLLAEQRNGWLQGLCILVETFVQQYPSLRSDTEALLDLIYNEVYLREQRGEAPRREEYLRRFPHLAGPIGDQFDVHQAIESGAAREPDRGRPTVPGYELLGEVGHGGMGRVFKARHEKLGRFVAVKMLREEHYRNRAVRKRFLAEARASALLDHPHIIKLLEVGECDLGPYFVMELIEGGSLEEMIRRGAPGPARAVEWLIGVAEAVHYAHGQGIIHRDLKPANIMIDAAGKPRVMDFGMAKIRREAGNSGLSSTQQGTILGTPAYMPPEQAGESKIGVGAYSDVYSLGAILYALLTGRPPFDEGDFVRTVLKVRSPEAPPPVRSLRPDVPELLERICLRCLHKNPTDRYATAGELGGALRVFIPPAGQSVVSAPVSLVSLATREVIPLMRESTLVGRGTECDLVLQTLDVSRKHCRITRTAEAVIVEDLGSSQGTRVNGSRVTRARLHHGDRLEIAGQGFQVVGVVGRG